MKIGGKENRKKRIEKFRERRGGFSVVNLVQCDGESFEGGRKTGENGTTHFWGTETNNISIAERESSMRELWKWGGLMDTRKWNELSLLFVA